MTAATTTALTLAVKVSVSRAPSHILLSKKSQGPRASQVQSNIYLKPERVCPVQGDGARTSITLDFGDGHALTYSNVSSIEDGIKHIYKAVGIYRVTATGENSLGSETAMLYLHVTCEILRSFLRFMFTNVHVYLLR